jgi:hypothetical protein
LSAKALVEATLRVPVLRSSLAPSTVVAALPADASRSIVLPISCVEPASAQFVASLCGSTRSLSTSFTARYCRWSVGSTTTSPWS